MDSDRFHRARELFDAARELPASAWEAFVARECGHDAALRSVVLDLLRIAGRAPSGPGARPVVSAEVPDSDEAGALPARLDPLAGRRVGSCVLRSLIGQGGMGCVYLAEQDRPRRHVAVKLIRPGLTSAHHLRRFELEADILGRLEHPAVARIYEAGQTDLGDGAQPYFVMELVPGMSLTAYAGGQRRAGESKPPLGLRARLELFARVVDAVHHAHQKGVIHRDLKPGNILVTDDGQPRVLDFGVARTTDADVQATTRETSVGQIIGTLAYMSPEQARGKPEDVDVRSDIYSLGVIAFELLSGRMPYDLRGQTIPEAVRVICDDEPTRLGQTATDGTSVLARQLRGDVETIVEKALTKDKEQRYASASDLAADVRRHLSDEPIVARPPSTWMQFRKFARRNAGFLVGVGVAFAFLILGSFATALFAWREYSLRNTTDEIVRGVLNVIDKTSPENVRGNRTTVVDILPQLGEAFSSIGWSRPDYGTHVLSRLAIASYRLGNAQAALDQNERALTFVDDFDAPGACEIRYHRAACLESLNRLDEAHKELIAISRVLSQTGRSPDTLLFRVQLLHATVLIGLNRLADAESMLRALLDRDVLASTTNQASALHTLASIAAARGDNTRAADLERQAMTLLVKARGADHPDAIIVRRNLALYEGRGDQGFQHSARLQHVIADEERLFEVDSVVSNLAMAELLIYTDKQPERAISHAERALQLTDPLKGEYAVWAHELLAWALHDTNRPLEAARAWMKGVEAARAQHVLESEGGITVLNNFANQSALNGQCEAAIEAFQELIPIKQRAGMDRDDMFYIALNNLGRSLQRCGRLSEAEPWLVKALEFARENECSRFRISEAESKLADLRTATREREDPSLRRRPASLPVSP